YIYTREELTERGQIDDRPVLKNLLSGVFGPPEDRPTVRELLSRLNEECPARRALDSQSRLDAGRQHFNAVRASKHPGVAAAADAGNGAGPGEPGAAAQQPPDQ